MSMQHHRLNGALPDNKSTGYITLRRAYHYSLCRSFASILRSNIRKSPKPCERSPPSSTSKSAQPQPLFHSCSTVVISQQLCINGLIHSCCVEMLFRRSVATGQAEEIAFTMGWRARVFAVFTAVRTGYEDRFNIVSDYGKVLDGVGFYGPSSATTH